MSSFKKRTRNEESQDTIVLSQETVDLLNDEDEFKDFSSQLTEILGDDEEPEEKAEEKAEEPAEEKAEEPADINYYILAHGSIIFPKREFNNPDVTHIAKPGELLVTSGLINVSTHDNPQFVFPVLHHLCNKSIKTVNPIDQDLHLSSSDCTNHYDGIFLCKENIAVRIIHFKKRKYTDGIERYDKYTLTYLVEFIKRQHAYLFPGKSFHIGVISCLIMKGITPTRCDYKSVSPNGCLSLVLTRSVTVGKPLTHKKIGTSSGGKSKKHNLKRKRKRTRKRPRSWKKTTQKNRRRC